LRSAVADLSWLLSRSYAPTSALKLVGDRWSLIDRQRAAVLRCACSDESRARREGHRASPAEVRGQVLLLDGFNVLTTIEAALGGAVVLLGRDGTCRDLAGVHGTYRKVEETRPALALLGEVLARLGASSIGWYLDRPVSNSGRLKGLILQAAADRGWDWRVELVPNPDPLLARSPDLVATADSAILDRCDRWVNLARLAIEQAVPPAFVVDLSLAPASRPEPGGSPDQGMPE
jgi:hypothetical protein